MRILEQSGGLVDPQFKFLFLKGKLRTIFGRKDVFFLVVYLGRVKVPSPKTLQGLTRSFIVKGNLALCEMLEYRNRIKYFV